MYGIITLSNGEMCSSAEFRTEPGRYGRGTACKACRIGRTKCSGTFDGKPCNRCKRLGKSCIYTNISIRHHKRLIEFPSDNDDTQSTRAASSEQVNPRAGPPDAIDSSLLDPSGDDTERLVTGDPIELDFDNWFQLQNPAMVTESFVSHTDLTATLPQTGFSDTLFDESQWGNETRETPSYFSALINRGTADIDMQYHELVIPESSPGRQRSRVVAGEFTCQYKCLQTMASSLTALRNETGSWGSGNPELRSGGVVSNCPRVERVLALFEKSMPQLQIVETCPLACILSQDLAILLLLVIEQLAKLLLSFGESSAGRTDPSSPDSPQQERSVGFARIGTFEITSPLDQQMIMKLLLQIRAQALDACICRWCDRIRSLGSKDLELEADLRMIREDLSKAVFLRLSYHHQPHRSDRSPTARKAPNPLFRNRALHQAYVVNAVS